MKLRSVHGTVLDLYYLFLKSVYGVSFFFDLSMNSAFHPPLLLNISPLHRYAQLQISALLLLKSRDQYNCGFDFSLAETIICMKHQWLLLAIQVQNFQFFTLQVCRLLSQFWDFSIRSSIIYWTLLLQMYQNVMTMCSALRSVHFVIKATPQIR